MRDRRTTAILSVLLAASLAAITGPTPAYAAEPNQVQGLTVAQGDGYATLAWTPVEGATDYQIERTPVAADDTATGPAVVTGVWRPNRQINNSSPTFADAGFNPGTRFQWRVRARFGTEAQPYSAPVAGTTSAPWGDPNVPGENLRTQWETTLAAQYTSDVNEYAYTAAIDELSDRVRVTEIGKTALGRPINMFVIGYPTPPATPEAVAATSPLMVNCNVHGNEPGDREGCLIMARKLAFSNDARTIDLLSHTTVLIVPTINGDGRAANTRGNSTGQDLNRDYSLIRQPETFALVNMLRQYRPIAGYDGHEFGNSSAGDLPMLPPRHQNVPQSIFDESQHMIEGHMYTQGAKDGWWPCPYGCNGGGNVGLSEETILRNTLGLKNVVNSLLELRSSGGTTRPDEGNTANNRRRKTYSAMWTFNQFLDYHRANLKEITTARADAITFQVSNTGRIVFRGSRPIPAHPAPHPGEAPPPLDAPRDGQILDNVPCAYKLTEEQYHGERTDGPAGQRTTVAQRLAAHGHKVVKVADGYVVPLAQPERGLIPLLLDGQAVEKLVDGERVYPTLTGKHSGQLVVSGVACLRDATVTGPVRVRPGGTLIATGSSITGPVDASGAAGVFLTDTAVAGPVRVTQTDGPVVVVDTKVTGPVEVSGNRGEAPLVAANTVTGPLSCGGNTQAPVNLGLSNSVEGPKSGQCASL
ncbi:M14 family zinc carboxypeptidase [Micromonospora sp. DR5-3]|uniref:M14 family zinc carboxypeptidase n=1 Tax=unclassified Micromonospora TaxID=2617518 RepID=UPI0011DC131E|nr:MULTISPECIES: M14 family zinc carboxypeptidase [unclassified Micromonospora]MCW3818084.1 M14 family zinc carboxypeptidase [Micromonospora sp. DR5-3]TYC22308.1 carboxypeptidase [Micromonospora sp. MP36]